MAFGRRGFAAVIAIGAIPVFDRRIAVACVEELLLVIVKIEFVPFAQSAEVCRAVARANFYGAFIAHLAGRPLAPAALPIEVLPDVQIVKYRIGLCSIPGLAQDPRAPTRESGHIGRVRAAITADQNEHFILLWALPCVKPAPLGQSASV